MILEAPTLIDVTASILHILTIVKHTLFPVGSGLPFVNCTLCLNEMSFVTGIPIHNNREQLALNMEFESLSMFFIAADVD